MRARLAEGFEKPAILVAQSGSFEQIGAVPECLAQLLLAPPAADLLVVAVEQNLRRLQAAEFRRARVMRVIEQSAGTVL